MGNTESTPHGVTVDRAELEDILITHDALEHLKSGAVDSSSKSVPEKAEVHANKAPTVPSPPSPVPPPSRQVPKAPPTASTPSSSPPYIASAFNPSSNTEEYYKKRLAELEKENKAALEEAALEYARTVERVEKKFVRPAQKPCCRTEQDLVEKCYQNNKDKPLNCSKIVDAYEKCVQDYRCALIQEKSPS